MKRSAAFAFVLTVLLCTTALGFDGSWTATRDDEKPDRIHLNLTRGRTNQMGTTFALAAFTDLTRAQVEATTALPVRFGLHREAGAATFEGSFLGGKGSGHFRFVPRPAFLADVRALGVPVHKSGDEELFALAMCDVTIAFIRSMIDEGYRVPLEDYLSMRIFDVTPEYIREMRSLGFQRISHDELVASRIHGVSPEYIREMRARGWDLSLDEYQANRIFDVTPEFAEQMGKLGYEELSRDDLVAFRVHDVSREFIREMRELGYDLDAAELIAARVHGVTPEFIREVADAGYVKVPFDKLLALRMGGVEIRMLEQLRSY